MGRASRLRSRTDGVPLGAARAWCASRPICPRRRQGRRVLPRAGDLAQRRALAGALPPADAAALDDGRPRCDSDAARRSPKSASARASATFRSSRRSATSNNLLDVRESALVLRSRRAVVPHQDRCRNAAGAHRGGLVLDLSRRRCARDRQRLVRMQYSAGFVVHDLERPHIVRYRSPRPVMVPEGIDETHGIVNNVVFPTAIERPSASARSSSFTAWPTRESAARGWSSRRRPKARRSPPPEPRRHERGHVAVLRRSRR